MSAPEPNSPEAKRAAQNVRTVFLLIAAANLILVAVVMWPRDRKDAPGEPAKNETSAPLTPAQKTAFNEMETLSEALVAAYNAKDAAQFAENFSPKASPLMDEEVFRKVIIGIYHEELGEVTEKKLNTSESNADPDYGMIVYQAVCKKSPKVKVSINFRRENGALKIVQCRMEKQ